MDNKVFIQNWGLHVQKPCTNGLKLWDPNVGVLAYISQFAVLKLGLEFQLRGHEIQSILVGKLFPCICSIAILVAITVAATDWLECNLAISCACINWEHKFFKSLLVFVMDLTFYFSAALVRLNFSESFGIGIVPSRIFSKSLAPCSCKELDLPELPVFLLSTESNGLEVLFFNEGHLVTWLLLISCLSAAGQCRPWTQTKILALKCAGMLLLYKRGQTENYDYY